MFRTQILFCGFCLVAALCVDVRHAVAADSAIYQQFVVAADHDLASEAGLEILRQGGNVVDAAVATGFSLSVLRPASSGLGGGGFMVIWDAKTRQSVAIDYRERAPRNATKSMYFDPKNKKQQVPELSYHGPLSVAIPGHVAGLCLAHQKFGKLKLNQVLAPAIRLAREGFPADAHEVEIQTATLSELARDPKREAYRVLSDRYLNHGMAVKLGSKVMSPQVEALELIARHGAKAFYEGDVAKGMVAAVGENGKWLTLEDLRTYQPTIRTCLKGQFDTYELITMPPPSSGGVALIESLNILQELERRHPEAKLSYAKRHEPETLHVLTEVLKHAFADRAEFLGDTDYVAVPVEQLLSSEHAKSLAQRIQLDATQRPEAYGRFVPPKDAGTTHFSVIDSQGNAVACTETVNTTFGSWIVEPRYGIVLNNEMDDFAAVPGTPNAFGLIQGEANSVAPGKRPLSSMTPTIAVRDGRAVFALGASGGPKIISATIQDLINMARYQMPPHEAVPAPRLHHQ
ncbi:MAG: gamma-glutamyltransferase, partial [Planctomycetaceae bacterium]|nr:gamma-glutamyltransferase [Planctomycetaceae bacterium]